MDITKECQKLKRDKKTSIKIRNSGLSFFLFSFLFLFLFLFIFDFLFLDSEVRVKVTICHNVTHTSVTSDGLVTVTVTSHEI